MKSKQNDKKAVTAVQFMGMIDDTMATMEAIGQQTQQEETALLESMGGNYVDDEGIFDMSNMLDVDIKGEESQPQLYNEPRKELTDTDKALIIEELAQVMKDMPGDVIDFSDVGPIATVIQTKLGYNQPLDGFINDLISGAVDKQDSQSFAKGEPVPGELDTQVASADVAPVEDKAPTDVAPEMAPADETSPEAPVVDEMVATDISEDTNIVEPVEMPVEEDVVEPIEDVVEEDVAMDDVAEPIEDDLEEVSAELDDVSAELDEVEDKVEDKTNEEVTEDIKEELDDVKEEVGDVEAEIVEEGLENDDDDELDISAQLESIKNDYLDSVKSDGVTIDALIESAQKELTEGYKKESEPMMEELDPVGKEDGDINNDGKEDEQDEYLKNRREKISDAMTEADDCDDEDKAVMEADDCDDEDKAVMEAEDVVFDEVDPVDAILESIAADYHRSEDAKELKALQESAAKQIESDLDAQLESIVSEYHAEEKLDAELDALVESYHKDSDKAKLENAQARKEAREAIEKLSE